MINPDTLVGRRVYRKEEAPMSKIISQPNEEIFLEQIKEEYFEQMLPFRSDFDELKDLLIPNLPALINAGNEKTKANFEAFKTFDAIRYKKFISFNSRERISWMIFDIDKVGEKTALEHYENINNLLTVLVEKLGFEPTYILQTEKGFHFAFHLKNHVFYNNKNAMRYLKAIKAEVIELLGCDKNASIRNRGIYRNPLNHRFYFSQNYNFELKAFRHLLKNDKPIVKRTETAQKTILSTNIDISIGNRNDGLWRYAMSYAKGLKNSGDIQREYIFKAIEELNNTLQEKLEEKELESIANSAYGYTIRDENLFPALTAKKRENVNYGAMCFQKIKGLSPKEYEQEVKSRRQMSAIRTNKNLTEEQEMTRRERALSNAENKAKVAKEKVMEAIRVMTFLQEKITVRSVADTAKVSKDTANLYLKQFRELNN